MNIYWTQKSVPELSDLTKPERKKAWRYAYGKCFRHWQTYAGLTICGGCGGLGSFLWDLPGAAIGGGIGGFIYGQIATAVGRAHLAAWRAVNLDAQQRDRGEQGGGGQAATSFEST